MLDPCISVHGRSVLYSSKPLFMSESVLFFVLDVHTEDSDLGLPERSRDHQHLREASHPHDVPPVCEAAAV